MDDYTAFLERAWDLFDQFRAEGILDAHEAFQLAWTLAGPCPLECP